jgi:hypothetical protein
MSCRGEFPKLNALNKFSKTHNRISLFYFSHIASAFSKISRDNIAFMIIGSIKPANIGTPERIAAPCLGAAPRHPSWLNRARGVGMPTKIGWSVRDVWQEAGERTNYHQLPVFSFRISDDWRLSSRAARNAMRVRSKHS